MLLSSFFFFVATVAKVNKQTVVIAAVSKVSKQTVVMVTVAKVNKQTVVIAAVAKVNKQSGHPIILPHPLTPNLLFFKRCPSNSNLIQPTYSKVSKMC